MSKTFSKLATQIKRGIDFFPRAGNRLFSNLFRRCPKTGKIRGINQEAWPKWAALLVGLAASLWYLLRVLPKPSRAAYPCQRATAPIRFGFLAVCVPLAAYVLSVTKARSLFRRKYRVWAGLFVALALLSLWVFIENDAPRALAGTPIGTGKGIFPGRVVWVYNTNAAKWTGTGNYWAAAVNPQAEYNKSFTAGIAALSGGTNDADAWDKLFRWFNTNHARAGTGYQPGDLIAIKINQNNSAAPAADIGNNMNANPQTCVAVVTSLVNAGVPQADIWIGDPSRAVTDNIFNAIHTAFPAVKVVDYFGNNGRVTSTNVDGVFPNNDVKNAESACFYNARYIINQPLLKGHDGQIVTFGSKNFYGINGILPVWSDNGNKHPNDSALTAYMTNANFGGKVILWAMDAMYPSLALNGLPYNGVALTPFNGRPMSSFILSLDGVAAECVSYDFWSAITGRTGGTTYMDSAARAGAGVSEHWNNSTAKQYSKNLNPNANGIELLLVNEIIKLPFPILSISAQTNTVGLTWASTAGAQYAVEYSLNLQTWSNLVTGIPAAPGTNTSLVLSLASSSTGTNDLLVQYQMGQFGPQIQDAFNTLSGGDLTKGSGLNLFDPNSPILYPTVPSVAVTFNVVTPDLATALGNNSFFTFTLKVGSNVTDLDLNSLTFNAARGGSGQPRGYAVFVTTPTTVNQQVQGDTVLTTERTNWGPLQNINLSSFASLQNLTAGQTVTFKIPVYSPATTSSLDFDNITLYGKSSFGSPLADVDAKAVYFRVRQ